MNRIAFIALLLILGQSAAVVVAKESDEFLHLTRADEFGSDVEARTGAGHFSRITGPDTVRYGDVGLDGFSILGDVWDWDNPEGSDPLMGWYATDATAQTGTYGRRITASIWEGHDNGVPAPILAGAGSLWIGAFEGEADAFCHWMSGLGYGNRWSQRILSPVIQLSSPDDVALHFRYFNDTETDYDYTRIILRRLPSGEETTISPFDGLTGKIGLSANETDPPIGANFDGEVTHGALQGATEFQLIFEMVADAGWSDEDALYKTNYGPFGIDDVVLSGGASASYDFDAGEQGWTFEPKPGAGTFLGVGNVSNYEILDPCGCEITGKLLEFHDDSGGHPQGQHELARSNPTDLLDMRANLPASPYQLQVLAEWDQYAVMPRANGAFFRAGWDYYPWICHRDGSIQWSGRVGGGSYFYIAGPECGSNRNVATASGVPESAEQIRFVYEIYVSCDAFGVTDCTFETNFTPIIDNVEIRGTKVPAAPIVAFSPGSSTTRYQDGFGQGTQVMNPNSVGNADVSYRRNGPPGNQSPVQLGDSLYVTGPISTPSLMWEARLWFKVRREGPGTKPARYSDWKADVDAINGNPNPTVGFAYAWMDSAQMGPNAFRNQFQSFCREDNLYPGEGGELTEGNEIIRDGVLVPGTAIDYFVTANYIGTPGENYFLPDTSGGFFFEFEILPSWRFDGGALKFPCLLYVDASDSPAAESVIESAFDALDIGHDRYDYNDAGSSWKPPFARGGAGSNNGVPLGQLMGYRGIVVNIGTYAAPMWPEDFSLLQEWITTNSCGGNQVRQGLILNGDNMAFALSERAPAFLSGIAGATFVSDAYHEDGDENYCVRLETPLGGGHKYGTTNSHSPGGYEYDAWGNWCPQQFRFDVLGTTSGGVGNRAYLNIGGEETSYAQVVRDAIGAGGNYRVVLDGVSYHHLSERDLVDECAADSTHVVDAVANELASALEWIWGGPGQIPQLCTVPPCGDAAVPEADSEIVGGVTHLYQNSPNPFNPRTVLRFSLARTGPVELMIFDVNGRKVRTLVNEAHEAGLHEVAWDGTDDAGRPVSSGVFWSQLATDDFTSNKKMVVLR